ncbi:Ataxin 2-like [Phytophthora pseudosyringae]|uniref:Ataxin 2-like n=1 Tax=Phytophthora pseudosyringae TaxID=221518 RepID=A0A8T1WAB9_9STRA|nr:Ataxin 2-like [Phytophthora pseudosyringae]
MQTTAARKSGNGGKKKKPQQSAPAGPRSAPPGFARSQAKPPSGFSDAHQRLLRHRALFAFRFLVGKAVELQLVASEERYAGILDCVDPDDFSVVLKSAKRVRSSGADAKPFEDGSTVIFRRHQLAHLVADGAVNYTDGVFASGASAVSGGFRTDTEISGQKGEHLFGRELEAASSWLDPALDTGALEEAPNGRRHSKNQGKAGWNQFEANEKLFGVVSSYDENIYTTKLDKSKISTEQSRAAEKLAQEIERQSAAGNFHLQEERGQAARGGGKHANDLDEEARYSSVDRRAADGNAYVPPALRDAQRQSSGGKSQAKETKAAPAAAVPAPPASEPAPAAAAAAGAPAPAPPAAPAAPKPLSFSEAVTGRSAAAPKEAPKSQPEEKKGGSGSPKKEAAPAQVNGKHTKPAAAKSKGSPKKKEPASGKGKKAENKTESKTEDKSSSKTTTTTTTTTTKQSTEETANAAPKKALNPNAKEFKLSAAAAAFTPSFSVPPAVKENVSSPYRGGSPGHMPYPHPGMGYPPPMQEEWMYGDGTGGEEGGEMAMPPYGYGVPVGPNGVPMIYPPLMHQQNMRMMGGQRGGYGGYQQQQQGYNPRGYYSPPNGGYPPYAGGPGMPQPPLPPTPSGDETPADGAPAPPVPETAPDVESAPSSSKQQSSVPKKK